MICERVQTVVDGVLDAVVLRACHKYVRIAELKESGVNCFNCNFVGNDRTERVKTLERFRNLIEQA